MAIIFRAGEILCSILVVCTWQHVICQGSSSKIICTINITETSEYDYESAFRRIADSNSADANVQSVNVCCEGYMPGINPICSSCDGTCQLGYCRSVDLDDVCNCLHNYNVFSSSQCHPVCTKGCGMHETCTAPNTCSCNDGYINDTRTNHCVSEGCAQNCQNGICDPEGICFCRLANASETVKCVNGMCSEGGECSCIPGHTQDADQNNTCIPDSCLDACTNGTCSTIGKCDCFEGFGNVGISSCDIRCPTMIPEYQMQCAELCETACENGNCTESGECNCLEGFTKDSVSMKCVIVCPSNTDDDRHNEECRRKCEDECHNGICDDYGACNCNSGFKQDENKVCITIVCPSTLESNNYFCMQKCHEHCTNGDCNERGECKCKVGYQMGSERQCEPACSSQCRTNEYCSAPDQCTCKADYIKMQGICEVKCSSNGDCVNGKCVQDGHCVCHVGYMPDAESVCRPVCSQACTHGSCDAPERCACDEGYKPDADSGRCVPRCYNGCEGGKCVLPDTCECEDGYALRRGECVDECLLNGSCEWKRILTGVMIGMLVVLGIGIVGSFVIRKRERVLLPFVNKDLHDTLPLERWTGEKQPGENADDVEEGNENAAIISLSHSRTAGDGFDENPSTKEGKVNREDTGTLQNENDGLSSADIKDDVMTGKNPSTESTGKLLKVDGNQMIEEAKAPETTEEVPLKAPESTKEMSSKAPESMKEMSSKAPESMKEMSSKAPESMKEVPLQAPESMKDVPLQAPESMKEVPLQAPESMKDVSLQAPESTKEMSSKAPESMKEMSSKAPESMKEVPLQAPESMKDVPLQAPESMKEVPLQAPESMKEVPLQAPESMKDVSLQAPESMKDLQLKAPEEDSTVEDVGGVGNGEKGADLVIEAKKSPCVTDEEEELVTDLDAD